MMTKSNSIGGGGDGSYLMGGFGESLIPSSSSSNINNNRSVAVNMDGGLGLPLASSSTLTILNGIGGGEAPIGDGTGSVTFSPAAGNNDFDLDLRRRTRNNSILAKIQELEANASVQATRSERLRMMRDEYESLVRKYSASGIGGSRKWGQGSNVYLKENNGNAYRQASYFARYSNNNSQQQPFIFAPGGVEVEILPAQHQQPMTTATESRNGNDGGHFSGTRYGVEESSHINSRFTTETGVNTDITGPVRPSASITTATATKKVKVVVDIGCQTEDTEPPASISLSSSPRDPFISNGIQGANQKSDGGGAVVSSLGSSSFGEVNGGYSPLWMAGGEKERAKSNNNNSVGSRSQLPMKMEMMMMMVEDEDNESLLEARERGKLQVTRLHDHHHSQLKEPKGNHFTATFDQITSQPSSPTGVTEKVFSFENSQREKENHHQKLNKGNEEGSENLTNKLQKINKKKEIWNTLGGGDSEENSPSDINHQLPNSTVLARRQIEIADLSLSDSTSLRFNEKHNKERKKLMEELQTVTRRQQKSKLRRDDDEDDQSSNEDDETVEEKSVAGEAAASASNSNLLLMVADGGNKCSSPPTTSQVGGATSESFSHSGTSSLLLMDSLQKTPDTLPRDDSELHEIAEEEIELDKDDDEESFSGGAVNNVVAAGRSYYYEEEPPASLEGYGESMNSRGEIKELVAHRYHPEDDDDDEKDVEINEAEEIRSNNLSSSPVAALKKLDVLVEEETGSVFTHPNNSNEEETKKEENGGINNDVTTLANKTMMVPSAFYVTTKKDEDDDNLEKKSSERNVVQMKGNDIDDGPLDKLQGKESIPTSSTAHSALANGTEQESHLSHDQNKIRQRGPTSKGSVSSSSTSSSEAGTSSSRQQSFEERVNNSTEDDNKTNVEETEKLNEGNEPNDSDKTMKEHNSLDKVNHPEINSGSSAENNETNSQTATNHSPAINVGGTGTTLKKGNGSFKKKTSTPKKNGESGNKSVKSSPQVKSGQVATPIAAAATGQPATVPSGITGANNTAKRFRLKFNYDDSESDSSEIAPPVSGKNNSSSSVSNTNAPEERKGGGVNVSRNSQGGHHQKTGNDGKEHGIHPANSKQDDNDDDFDNFFDM